MKVLVTGVNGQLGSEILKVFKDHDLHGFSKEQLDVTNHAAVRACIEKIEPEVVVHCAAYTNVDGCESNADFAYRVNAVGASNVASECLKIGAAMVYISTDYVFDGQKGQPYYEFDEPNPINTYGKTKLAGEEIVKSILKRFYIIRTAWLYGENGKNFVKTMLELSKAQKMINVVDDQTGSPTNALDLAKAIKALIESEKFGIYHVTNSGSCSWYDFARKIFELRGLDVEVKPISTEQINRPAKRPAYSVLKNFNLETNLKYSMRAWEEALEEYLN